MFALYLHCWLTSLYAYIRHRGRPALLQPHHQGSFCDALRVVGNSSRQPQPCFCDYTSSTRNMEVDSDNELLRTLASGEIIEKFAILVHSLVEPAANYQLGRLGQSSSLRSLPG
jgi:hypothetical protein